MLKTCRRRACLYSRYTIIFLFFMVVLYFIAPLDTKIVLLSKPFSARCASSLPSEHHSCRNDESQDIIPNIVHLVYILKDPVDGTFGFQFSHYLSIYAAWHLWKPETIYLHTNVESNSTAVQKAQRGESGKWTRCFFDIPALQINTVSVPTHANNGVKINRIEHQADFVRVQAIYDVGGVYIDLDVHALRDIAPLRKTGYAAVAGRQWDGYLNSGTFLAAKRSRMVKMWMDRMHQVYNGGWTTHSNTALTTVGKQLATSKDTQDTCSMLRLSSAAFAPIGWNWFDEERLFGNYFDAPSIYFDYAGHLLDFTNEEPDSDQKSTLSWTHDWRCTYLLHAFSPKKPRYGVLDNGISPGYVVQRRSNFARAVYPIVRSMLEGGYIEKQDLELEPNN